MEDLQQLRRKLHSHPELSGQETGTQKIILTYLKQFSPTKIIHLANNKALLVEFDSGKSGKNIIFRSDLDALPIQELNTFPHSSKNTGVAHKCGHDGHMTLACSLPAIWKSADRTGKLGLLFQHAEEIAVGAKEIIQDKSFRDWKPDCILGLHNLPGVDTGEIVIAKDIFSCASVGVRISFAGVSSHAGEPEKAVSPYESLIKLSEKARELISTEENDSFFLSTLVHMNLGQENYGITPGDGMICFTMRAKRSEVLQKNKEGIIQFCETMALNAGLKVMVEEFDYFPATQNTADLVEEITAAAKSAGITLQKKDFPFRWSEDFGFYADVCDCAYFGIGNGLESLPLHHPEYDFNEKVITSFQKLFASIFSGSPRKE